MKTQSAAPVLNAKINEFIKTVVNELGKLNEFIPLEAMPTQLMDAIRLMVELERDLEISPECVTYGPPNNPQKNQ